MSTNGIKQRDIRPCSSCGKGLMHNNDICCTRVVVTRFAADIAAIKRHTGLEMMVGGHAAIAHALGADEDILVPLGEPEEHFLCDSCARDRTVMSLYELNTQSRVAPLESSGLGG